MKTIELTQGKVALVDDEDFDRVNQFKWFAHRRANLFYAVRHLPTANGKRPTQSMHQFLMPDFSEIDHINGSGLDNRRENIRVATRSQNLMNARKKSGCSSQYKGVHWKKEAGCWCCEIWPNGHRLNLGRFEDETDAAIVYDYAAKIYFGEFARLNFP